MSQNIVFCGVGGQGTVLASKLTAAAAMEKGFSVMSAETIGMAQKGGSVFSFLRIGSDAATAMIMPGTADMLIAFEPGEAVKMLPFLKASGIAVVNSEPVMPVGAALSGLPYDGKEAVEYLQRNCAHLLLVDVAAPCKAAGSPKCMNIAMLAYATATGALCISPEDLEAALRKKLPPKLLDINLRALNAVLAKEEKL